MKVDLTKKPYFLTEEQIQWVKQTIASMTLEEKLQQLFFGLTSSFEENSLKEYIRTCKCGGIRYNPARPEVVAHHNLTLQKESEIPLFIAANTESGGNGAFVTGTEVGCETKVASTGDIHLAYGLGKVSAREAKSVGCNVLFAPIVDIDYEFHNPIIATRTFGNDPEMVKEYSLAFLEAAKEEGVIACVKHFPGDGIDERDHHLSLTANTLSKEEWDKSYGAVYRSVIDSGVEMIMVGHIALPCYQKKMLPATVSKELLTDLLREKLSFQGLIISDATHMVGLTACMKRSEFLPLMIQAGIDMILFYNDYEEDLNYLKKGYEKGIIKEERLEDALLRIIGLKAKLNLHKKKEFTFAPELIHQEESLKYQDEVARKGIVLVKEEKGVLPLSKEKYKRILLVPQHSDNPFESILPKQGPSIYETLQEKLVQEGFEVEIFESLMEKAKKLPPQEAMKIVMNIYNNKTPIKALTDRYDLVIHVMDYDTHNTVNRVSWQMSKGTPDIPWYVNELPTIMISLKNPFHLFDAPMIKTYINCYDKNQKTISHLIEKLVGREDFVGTSPVDCFCNCRILKRKES